MCWAVVPRSRDLKVLMFERFDTSLKVYGICWGGVGVCGRGSHTDRPKDADTWHWTFDNKCGICVWQGVQEHAWPEDSPGQIEMHVDGARFTVLRNYAWWDTGGARPEVTQPCSELLSDSSPRPLQTIRNIRTLMGQVAPNLQGEGVAPIWLKTPMLFWKQLPMVKMNNTSRQWPLSSLPYHLRYLGWRRRVATSGLVTRIAGESAGQ